MGRHVVKKRACVKHQQARPRDSLAPFCSEAPKRNTPVDQEAQGDSAGSVNQPVAQALPAALRVDTSKGDTPNLPEAAGDTSMSSVVTVKAPENSPTPKVDERKDANELPLGKSGVQTPTNVAAAPKRPHPPASNDTAETAMPGLEEPPAKTSQGRRPSIRPRPNIPAEKRGGNVEPVGQKVTHWSTSWTKQTRKKQQELTQTLLWKMGCHAVKKRACVKHQTRPPSKAEPMTGIESDSGTVTGKRPRDEGKKEKGTTAATPDEPPAKTTPARRPLLRPRPNISSERKTAETPPSPP
ncbi:hypothetical protein MRX96_041445 [Rhipicephalus microplus]